MSATKPIRLWVAATSAGPYLRRYIAATRDDAIAGFRAAYDRAPDTVDATGSADIDRGRYGDIRTLPALDSNYQRPVRGNIGAISAAWHAANADAIRAANTPLPAPADTGDHLTGFYDPGQDDDDDDTDRSALIAAAAATMLPWDQVRGRQHVSLSAGGYSIPPGGWLSVDDAMAACVFLIGLGYQLVVYTTDGKVDMQIDL